MTTFENDIRLAYISTLLDGGYTLLQEGTENPTIGYIVGGATKSETMVLHADVEVTEQYAEFHKLWLRYSMKVIQYNDWEGRRLSGVGTWIHESKIVFDIVQHFHGLDEATQQANQRKEIAIWDCKNQKEITL